MDADAHDQLVLARAMGVVGGYPAVELDHRRAGGLDLRKRQEGPVACRVDDAAAAIGNHAVEVVEAALLQAAAGLVAEPGEIRRRATMSENISTAWRWNSSSI